MNVGTPHPTLGIILAATIALSATIACAESSSVCEIFQNEWDRARQALAARVDEFAKMREESITPKIERDLARRGAQVSMARIVQSILRERDRGLSDLRRKVEDDLRNERNAFDRWRLCIGDSRRISRSAQRAQPEVIERERFMMRVSELLLDEAYLQYRDGRRAAPASASAYDPSNASYARDRESVRDWTMTPSGRWR